MVAGLLIGELFILLVFDFFLGYEESSPEWLFLIAIVIKYYFIAVGFLVGVWANSRKKRVNQ